MNPIGAGARLFWSPPRREEATYRAGIYTDPEGQMQATWQGPATGAVDWAHGRLRARAPITAYEDRGLDLPKGTLVRRLLVIGARDGGPAPASVVVDTGRAEPRYRFGARACIR